MPWLVGVTAAINNLSALKAGTTDIAQWLLLHEAREQIKQLYSGSVYAQHLRISFEKSQELLAVLNDILGRATSVEIELNPYDVFQAQHLKDELTTILTAELSTMPIYLVRQKGGFDVALLIHAAWQLFPDTTLAKAPETGMDIEQAGKAIAFELATAAGFHIFRILEAILKRYWNAVTNNSPQPKLQTIGSYATELRKGSHGDQKVYETLEQIAKLHRNPIIHPEIILSIDEAIETLGIARSAVSMMLRAIPEAQTTTSTIAALSVPAAP
jgi:hypothetical protein